MKKVLIISYYWPPSAGSGVQRWLKFAKYLPKFNWKPFIYTPKNPYFEIKDDKLLSNMPSELVVWKKNIWEPYALKDKIFGKGQKDQSAGIISTKKSFKNTLLNWIRGNIFIPDPKIFWIKSSVKFLLSKIKKEDIGYVITTGPPHSIHLIGLEIKKNIPNIKWISDFRDPWSKLDLLQEFHLTKYALRRHQKLEKRVLDSSDLVLTVSERWLNEFIELGANKVELITNGFDSEDFNLNKKNNNNKFIIGHYGLLNHLRNPIYLWKALDIMCYENPDFKSKLELHFSGNVDQEVMEQINAFPNLKDKVKYLGYLTHSKVIEQYNNASVLLLLLFNSESGLGNYPGKIFEYFASNKPILAFGPNNSDTQELIKQTNSGIYCCYDEQDIKDKILDLYNNTDKFRVSDYERFSRKKLTQRLSTVLNDL